LDKIDRIRGSIIGKVPNIYFIHGDLKDEDINNLYNHPKVKAMLSFARGEGFGRPLLEFNSKPKNLLFQKSLNRLKR